MASPDQLRMVPAAVEFARSLFQAGKPAAVIRHGPWTLLEAGLARGRTMTSLPSLQTDIRNAAGTWVNTEVHVCINGWCRRRPREARNPCSRQSRPHAWPGHFRGDAA